MPSANVTLYAQWTALPTYSVSYAANGASSGSAPTDANSYLAGATVTVLGNTGSLVKTGYTFAGWNTAADGSGTSYAPAASFAMPSANVTLYAQWTALPVYSDNYGGISGGGGGGGSAITLQPTNLNVAQPIVAPISKSTAPTAKNETNLNLLEFDLKPGSNSQEGKRLRDFLAKHGFIKVSNKQLSKDKDSGVYDITVINALKAFQKRYLGVKYATGLLGTQTRMKINEIIEQESK